VAAPLEVPMEVVTGVAAAEEEDMDVKFSLILGISGLLKKFLLIP